MPTLKELVEQLPPDLQEEAKDFVEVMKMSSIIDTPAFTGGVLFHSSSSACPASSLPCIDT